MQLLEVGRVNSLSRRSNVPVSYSTYLRLLDALQCSEAGCEALVVRNAVENGVEVSNSSQQDGEQQLM